MSLYRRAGSQFWWFRFQVAGQEFRGSTGEADRARAVRVEAQRKAEELARAPHGGAEAFRLGRLQYLGALDVKSAEDRKVSPGYLRALRWMWKAIGAHFGPTLTARDLSPNLLADYVAARRLAGIRGQSIRRELLALRRACALAVRNGWLGKVTAEWPRVKSDPPHPARSGKLRAAATINAVLADLPADVSDEYRFAALTGLRAAELGRVESSWMEPSVAGPILRVPAWASKTRIERVIALSAPAVEILRRRAEHSPVFSGADHQVRVGRASRAAGLPSTLTLRDLRVFYASEGLAGSGDAAAVQAALGHADLETTQRYQRSTLERAAKVSRAAAEALSAQDTPHSGRKSKRARTLGPDGAASQGTPDEQFQAVECPNCAAELQRVIAEHASGRHRSVGTVEPAPPRKRRAA